MITSRILHLLSTLALCLAAVAREAQADNTHYRYRPAGKGIEVEDGMGRFNRPLYSTVDRPWRLVALAGDRPEFMLMQISSTKNMTKLANLKIGLADGHWLETLTPVVARYDRGWQQYRVGANETAIGVDAVRARAFDGLILRVKRQGKSGAPLVLALGGRGANNYDQNPERSAFNPGECHGTTLAFSDNVLTLSGKGLPLHATGSTRLNFAATDPKKVANGPGALLAAPVERDAVAAITAAWPEHGELYFILTPDARDSAGFKAFQEDPAKVFAAAVRDNQAIASVIEVNTPDPYFNAAHPAMMLGYESSWNAPSFRHGAIAWHDNYAGWRSTYGGTVAGWHGHVQSHARAFYDKQHENGRIPAMLERDGIYNMGEVLVDQALYDYEWTGDLEPLETGGFDAIARHLAWGEKHVRSPDGLYENFLNAWNTDYKWCNGGGGTIASAYFWRANQTMAEIAGRLGKDTSVFRKRAEEIAKAMKSRLWSEKNGVYGEYRDRFGHQLLHESPDLSSIYTPIDLGFCDPFEAYRMLRFALRRFETIRGLPRDGAILYSSEWLPDHYSTRGIFTAEIINTLLALYRIGQTDAAEPFRRAIDGSAFAGPAPGATGYVINPDGSFRQHTDFTDTTSMYVRNVVEGLFGVRMLVPDQRVILQPSFPLEWEHATIRMPAAGYQYTWNDGIETMEIQTPGDLKPTVRLRARRAAIDKVTVNGQPAAYRMEAGIGLGWMVVEAPLGKKTQVRIAYGNEALPEAVTPAAGVAGGTCDVRVDRGKIVAVRQSRSAAEGARIADDGRGCVIPLPGEPGVATYFVLVRHGNVEMWKPVEVDVRSADAALQATKKADDANLQPQPVDLGKWVNQRLMDLHANRYSPRIEPFYWAKQDGLRTLQANGRVWWETHGRAAVTADTSLVTAANGRFVVDDRIPFALATEGKDAIFTSLYEQFPDRVEIPVNQRGSKVAVLAVASIPMSQSRMDNGRIRVKLDDGTHRDLVLRDPETIDDWLGSGLAKPYALGGHPVALGKNAHGHLYELDLGGNHTVKSVELATFTNETMIGLLGITVLQTPGK
jgi:hypothetical protein